MRLNQSLPFAAMLLVLCRAAQADMPCPPAVPLPGARVTIGDGSAALQFAVEVADTQAARAAGLMCRDSLPEGRGMLFVYPVPREVGMWMQNMRMALDMLFIGDDGHIVRIAENVAPEPNSRIHSGQPVRAVLELPAGTVDRHGIRVGDRVTRSAP